MTDQSSPSPPTDAGLGKRVARLKRYLVTTLTGKPDPVIQAKEDEKARMQYWTSILTGEKEQDCPAKYFRKTSYKLRASGDLAAAEDICKRGVLLHPQDLLLAIEHAEIAKSSKNRKNGIRRWQHVLDLAGDHAPLVAFRHLADACLHAGFFDRAESVLRRGLEIHPADFFLEEKLANLLAVNSSPAKALDALKSLIHSHPAADLASAYLRMAGLMAEEGLLDRATESLREALDKYPESSEILNRLGELSYLREKSSRSRRNDGPASSHLSDSSQDRFPPHAEGALCFSVGHDALRQHVPAMLGFARLLPQPTTPRPLPEVDSFAVWGPPNAQNPTILELASAEEKPLLCLESGFLSSPGIEGKNHAAHSVIVCPDNIYFDTTRATYLESRLNSENYTLTKEQQARAEAAVASIVSKRVSKFNHAPGIDLRPRFPADGSRRILLIDQKKGPGSLHWSFGGPRAFERMLQAALALTDHQVLIKLHPEVISGGEKSHVLSLLPDPLPDHIVLIDYDVNPFDLFDVVDDVFVCTSQLGFEAMMAGKTVHCFAAPFYSGWGLTTDRMIVPRRKAKRTLYEIFHLFYIEHSRYFVPGKEAAEIEDLIDYLAEQRHPEPDGSIDSNHSPSPPAEAVAAPGRDRSKGKPLNVLIIVHCRRSGASGRYLQNLARSLAGQGCKVMVLAEGKCPTLDNGVPWRTIRFEGTRLSSSLREEIVAFAPHIVYESGVRSRAQRAALEVMLLTDARLAMQSEDDDVQAHETQHGEAAALAMSMIDKPTLNADDILRFLQNNNWRHTLNVAFNPAFDGWIEPVLRLLCYRLASLHTAIWYPFERRLAEQYKVPTMVVPPVSSRQDFESIPLTREERKTILTRHGMDESDTIFFLGGALYPFSNEYSIFLAALNLAHLKTGKQIALVISSGAGRPKLPIDTMARQGLLPQISFTDLGKINDIGYTEMLKACDVVCSPGIPDTFNKFRLPSRLVKAMAMGKPILTGRCGFGESLEHGHNAFLTDGEDAHDWSDVIACCLAPDQRETVGKNGRIFAGRHFNSDLVAAELKKKFDAMMEGPPRGLGDNILHGKEDPPPADLSQTRSMIKAFSADRYRSTMQEAMKLLELLTPELGTVLHIGAGKCGELENYCRLGAKQITLVEPLPELADSLKEFENLEGKIHITRTAVAGEGGVRRAYVCKNVRPDSDDSEELFFSNPAELLNLHPSLQVVRTEDFETHTIEEICRDFSFSGSNDLLVLELQGLELEVMKTAPVTLMRKFSWIAIRVSETPLFDNGATSPLVKKTLRDLGYEYIPSTPNFSGPQVAALFRNLNMT